MTKKRHSTAVLLIAAAAILALLYGNFSKPSAAQGLRQQANIGLLLRGIAASDAATLFGSAFRMSHRLSFIDAYVVTGDHPQFGGWSGLAYERDKDRFVAVNDTGHWLTFRRPDPRPDASDPIQIAAHIGPILDTAGKPAAGSGPRDVEAVALAGSGSFLSYESPSSGLYYSPQRNLETARFRRLYPLSHAFSALPKGYGIEALTAISDASHPQAPTLLAIAERPLAQESRRIDAWLIQPGPALAATPSRSLAPPQLTASPLSLDDTDGYDISEIAWSSACGLFGIQRKLTWYGRLKIRLLKLSLTADRRSISSEVLFSGDSGGDAIDNYEGLAIVDEAPGVCELYALSDDNFLPIQKTILLHFRYRGGA